MANQIPLAEFGLEEAVEQQMVIWLENLVTQFTGQQTGGTQPQVKVASMWNKLLTPAYPFIGVRAHMPTWEPTFLADYDSVDPTTQRPMYSKVNEILINLHMECEEYRQIQRLYSFLQMMLEFSYDPLAFQQTGEYESWLSQIRNWGLVINGWTASPVTPVTQTAKATDNSPASFPRTDVITLWERDINLNCDLNTRVVLAPTIPIVEIDQTFTIILPGP